MIREISMNMPLKPGDALYHIVINEIDTPAFLHNKSNLTFINPEYNQPYRQGILPIMRGLVQAANELTVVNDNTITRTSIFGFNDFPKAKLHDGEETSMFVASLIRKLTGQFDDPEAAVAAYHRNIINQTNDVLVQLESPLRLTPIET